MATTIADVQLQIAYRMGENSAPNDTNESARRLRFINDGHRRVIGHDYWWFLSTIAATQTVVDQENYTLATNFRDMIELRIDEKVASPVQDTDIYQNYSYPPNYYYTSATQQFFIYGDNELHLVPRPASAPSALSVSSITRSSTTATATTTTDHGFEVNMWVQIAGADQTDYNGSFRITSVPSSTTFTFEVENSPTTPATGTITVTKNNIVYRYWRKHVDFTADTDTIIIPDEYSEIVAAYVFYRLRGSMRGLFDVATDAANEFNSLLTDLVAENNRRKFYFKESLPRAERRADVNDYTVTQ